MKKVELIESYNKKLERKYHPDTLAIYMGMAFNTIIYETFRKSMGNLDLYSKKFTASVDYNEDEDFYYSLLPKPIIQLPGAGDGVRAIKTQKGKKVEFIPVGSTLQSVHEHLEISQVPGPVPYTVMDNMIIYSKKNGIYNVDTVYMWLVIPFNEYDDLDEINIPSGKDVMLFDLTMQMAKEKAAEKEINDQSEKTK